MSSAQMALQVTILSPECTLFKGEVSGLLLPGVMGEFEILAHHAPLVAMLGAGKIVFRGVATQDIEIVSGFVEVHQNEVIVCVE